MGENEKLFNPSLTDDQTSLVNCKFPSGVIAESIGPGVSVLRDAEGEVIGLYDDMGNPVMP